MLNSNILDVPFCGRYNGGVDMVTDMQLEKEHLEQIGQYVKSHFNEWLCEAMPRYSRDYEIDLRERVVRVEEELKSQRELMMRGFDQVDKRFEDQREAMKFGFGQMNKRFTQLMWMIGIGATATISVVVAISKG
jgi:hypothetical protein